MAYYYLPVVSKAFFKYYLRGKWSSETRTATIKANPAITDINDSIEHIYKKFCEYVAEKYSKIDYEYICIVGMKAEFRDKALATLNICFYDYKEDVTRLMQNKIYKLTQTDETIRC
jgi:hypothetical protein